MPALAIAAAAVAVSAAGVGLSYMGQKQAAEDKAQAAVNQSAINQEQVKTAEEQQKVVDIGAAQEQSTIQTQKQVIALQQQADSIRQQAANLDATRRQREFVRQSIAARSGALTAATNQGAGAPGSSAVAGAYGGISGRQGVNTLGVFQQLQAGTALFDINKTVSNVYLTAQDQNSQFVEQSRQARQNVIEAQKRVFALGGQTNLMYADAAKAEGTSALGGSLSSLGGSVIKNFDTFTRVGTYFGGKSNPVNVGSAIQVGSSEDA